MHTWGDFNSGIVAAEEGEAFEVGDASAVPEEGGDAFEGGEANEAPGPGLVGDASGSRTISLGLLPPTGITPAPNEPRGDIRLKRWALPGLARVDAVPDLMMAASSSGDVTTTTPSGGRRLLLGDRDSASTTGSGRSATAGSATG